MAHYLPHLQKDPQLATILGNTTHQLQLRSNIPLRLMGSIMSQQLSTKVAAVIYQRFLALFDGNEPTPQQVLQMPHEQLRAVGLSNAKAQYVKNVADFCTQHAITDEKLLAMPNEAIIDLLVQIKGVGRWTVEMLLMFALGREDVFAVDDWGIRQAMVHIYQLDVSDKKLLKKQIIAISEQWQPYRTYACLHLWRWKDNVPEV